MEHEERLEPCESNNTWSARCSVNIAFDVPASLMWSLSCGQSKIWVLEDMDTKGPVSADTPSLQLEPDLAQSHLVASRPVPERCYARQSISSYEAYEGKIQLTEGFPITHEPLSTKDDREIGNQSIDYLRMSR